jgi:endonuclease/exonuclease/phosphatase family metal-dependent hydrolase
MLIAEFKDYFFCCTHLSLTEEDRLKSVEIINDLFHEPGKPVFLAGDFNAQPESEVLTNLKKNWLLLNNPDHPTIPADNPSRCIDYIFSLKAGNSSIYFEESAVEKEPVASDHLPVRVKIKFINK